MFVTPFVRNDTKIVGPKSTETINKNIVFKIYNYGIFLVVVVFFYLFYYLVNITAELCKNPPSVSGALRDRLWLGSLLYCHTSPTLLKPSRLEILISPSGSKSFIMIFKSSQSKYSQQQINNTQAPFTYGLSDGTVESVKRPISKEMNEC